MFSMSYECPQCGSVFDHAGEFTRHIAKHFHKTAVIDVSELRVKEKIWDIYASFFQSNTEGEWNCAQCGLICESVTALQKHYNTHKVRIDLRNKYDLNGVTAKVQFLYQLCLSQRQARKCYKRNGDRGLG